MNMTILFRCTLLACMYHGVCTPLGAAARKNPYQITTKVDNAQGIVKDADVTITFTFSYDNEALTVQRFIELSENYDDDLQEMMVKLSSAIHQQADAYMLWDGFATTAQLASQDANKPFTIIMRGRCQPHKRDPKDRSDPFMQYEGLPAGKYAYIKAKKMGARYQDAVEQHALTVSRVEQGCRNLVFTASGHSVFVMPMMKVTTPYDFFKHGTDVQIVSYWHTVLEVMRKYGATMSRWVLESGHTYGQRSPHVYLQCYLSKRLSEEGRVVGWEANGKVTFQTLEPLVTPPKPLVQDDDAAPFWQRPEGIAVGVCIVLAALWCVYRGLQEAVEEEAGTEEETRVRRGLGTSDKQGR